MPVFADVAISTEGIAVISAVVAALWRAAILAKKDQVAALTAEVERLREKLAAREQQIEKLWSERTGVEPFTRDVPEGE